MAPEELVNLSALNQFAYCPRRRGSIYLEGGFEDNVHTARGSAEHEHVDRVAHMTAGIVFRERAWWAGAISMQQLDDTDLRDNKAQDAINRTEWLQIRCQATKPSFSSTSDTSSHSVSIRASCHARSPWRAMRSFSTSLSASA